MSGRRRSSRTSRAPQKDVLKAICTGPIKRTPKHVGDPAAAADATDVEYVVRAIKACGSMKAGNTEYLISWQGWHLNKEGTADVSHDTWEPTHHLPGMEESITAFHEQQRLDQEKHAIEDLAKKQASRQRKELNQEAGMHNFSMFD
jgi:hypothetical protein